MQLNEMLPRYLDALLEGDRLQAREIVRKAIATGIKAQAIYKELLIAATEQIEQMHGADRISSLVEHLAIRINRFITDQVQAQLLPAEPNGNTAVIISGEREAEELGGQACADLLEAAGWKSFFLGGGVPEDELIELIGTIKPELMVVYGSRPPNVPRLREMIERIRDIGASPLMNIFVTGGIFDRVEGLWEEIQADYYAPDPVTMIEAAAKAPQRLHLPRDPLAPKRRRRLVPGPLSVN